MTDNPKNNSADTQDPKQGFVLPRTDPKLAPLASGGNEAAEVIRQKLAKIYASEPDALEEEREAETVKPRSKHQQFMYDLNHSGKDLAQIQTEWHNYYINLPDDEKHVVWQEFYASSQAVQHPDSTNTDASHQLAIMRNQLGAHNPLTPVVPTPKITPDTRSATEVQNDIKQHASGKRRRKKPTAKQHVQSLIFGLSIGFVAVLIFLFGFFNEVIIAPFIQPARTTAATPLIITADTVAPSAEPQVIIPKINVQIPIQFDINATDEATMQKELESGIAHYPTTSSPGQNGNSAYFGHSSNNIFNKGKYKFAFVLLHQLVPGDTFYITKDKKVYAYKVFDKKIVEPNQVEVLDPVAGHTATATLITCDPPGTSLRRLVVTGDQISPDVSGNTAASTNTEITAEAQLTGNGPTLWGRFISQTFGKVVLVLFVLTTFVVVLRVTRPKY
jgi:sortase A